MYSSNIKIKVSFVLLAAGKSTRMNMSTEKQFLLLKEKPLFAYSLEVANNSSLISEIIVVTNKEKIDFVKKYCEDNNINKIKIIIEGGKERQESVYNALEYISEDIKYVAIHDSARPNLENFYLENSIEMLEKEKDISGTVIGIFARDTIKIVDENNLIIKTLNRNEIIQTQTPQIFRKNKIIEAHEFAKEKNIYATDDAMLLEYMKEKVKLVEGKNNNLKITFIEDLKFL